MNVLYIDVDSLRADHVGAYGYEAPTTPNIDAVAAEAVQFERAYVANSPCLPSRAALVSGRYGIHNGVETHGPMAQTLQSPKHSRPWYGTWCEDAAREGRKWMAETTGWSRDWLTLPEVFFHDRTRTGAVSSFPRHTAPWFYHLWHDYRHPQEPPGEDEYMQTPRAETVVDESLAFLDETDGEFFLYVQFWDPHAPYNRTDEQVERFRGEDLPPYPTREQIEDHQRWEAWRCASQLGIEDREDLDELIAQYDAEIRYVDAQIGRLIQTLRERGRYDETLIVLTADHGEEFGEHGLYREHWSTHDGTQRVPLLVKPPVDTQYDAGTREHLVTNVDVAPTLTDYAGIETPERWQGQSLRPIVADAHTDWRDAIVFDHGLYTAQRAVRTDRWKFIRTYHPGMYSGVLPERQLFDMANDPWEQENIADAYPDVVEELEARMALWADRHVGPEEDALHAVARAGPAGYRVQQQFWKGI